jgi:phosphatidylglycerol lysyltransferase
VNATDRARARELVMELGWNASAYQILNPGLSLWFSAAGDAVAGYVPFGDRWIVAGAPVCSEARIDAVSRELDVAAPRTIYFGAGERLARTLEADRTHHVVRIGAQPVWDPRAWPSIVRTKASLRAQLNRARNKGVSVTELNAPVAERHPALEGVRAAWLTTRGLPPLHFLTESDTLGDLRDRRVFVAERERVGVVAFLVATPVPARNGWLIEQWPRLREAPNGTIQLLVDAAMRAIAESGGEYGTMGLAPLSENAGPLWTGEPLWLRVLMQWLRAHGRRFYNFRGLEAFKAAFMPQSWEALYLATRSPRLTLGDLRAVAGVFGGGSPERFVGRALLSALKKELSSRA